MLIVNNGVEQQKQGNRNAAEVCRLWWVESKTRATEWEQLADKR